MDNIAAKKSLGQHFLTSRKALADIITSSQIKQGENILEIGPGTGILTEQLLKSGAIVTAVEMDERAIALLQSKFASAINDKKLILIQGDILDKDIITKTALNSGSFAIIANIPYYITGAILEQFLEHGPRPNRLTLLVQKEVANRIVAKDGKESVLSISVKAFGEPKIISTVPRGAFNPPPEVDSAILVIENVSDIKLKDANIEPSLFFTIVKTGFAHKRKLLKRNLEANFEKNKISDAWKALHLSDNVRAEDVSMEEWLKIAKNL